MSPQDVAHAWANQHQDEARNSNGSFYFWKDTIYSYGSHFPIAKHVTNEQGERATLITSRTYSSTTSGHVSIVRSAANHKNLIYCHNPEWGVKDNLNVWITEAENTAACLVKARKPEKYILELGQIEASAKKYADFMGAELPERLLAITGAKNSEEYTAYMLKKKSLLEAEAKAEKARQLKQFNKTLKKWEKGEIGRMTARSPKNIDYVRMTKDDEVETSQGVKIPKAVAQRFYDRLVSGQVKEGDPFLNFTVKTANATEVVIGCHRYKMAYISKFVAKHF